MSLVEEDCNDKLDDLTKRQLDTLSEWEAKFQEKYKVVGKVGCSPFLADSPAHNTPEPTIDNSMASDFQDTHAVHHA